MELCFIRALKSVSSSEKETYTIDRDRGSIKKEDYKSVESSEIISTNINPWVVDNLRRSQLTAVVHFSVVIYHTKRNGTGEWIQNIPYNPTNNKRIASRRHN